MSTLRRFFGRHAGLLLALVLCSYLTRSQPTKQPQPRVVLPDHEARVVEFSPDSRVMVTDGDSGGCVRDVATGRVLVPLMRATSNGPSRATKITWPRFTPDGRSLIVQLGGPRFDQIPTVTLAIFDVATGRELASFDRVGSNIWFGSALPPPEYSLSADGATLAFTRIRDFRNERVTIWDVETRKTIVEFSGGPPLALSLNGSMIAYGDVRTENAFPAIRKIRATRHSTQQVTHYSTSGGMNAGPVAFSPDDKLLAAVTPTGQPEVRTVSAMSMAAGEHELDDGQSRNLPIHLDGGWFSSKGAWFSRDARHLFVDHLGGYTDIRSIEAWDMTGRIPTLVLKVPAEGVAPEVGRMTMAHFDHISRWNPEARDNSEVKVFDLPSSQPRLKFTETGVHFASISPDGRLLVTPSIRRETTGINRLLRIVGLFWRVVGLSPGWLPGKGASVPIRDIRFYDADTGQLIGTIDLSKDHAKRGSEVPTVGFSPDGKTLVFSYPPVNRSWDSRNPMVDWSVELWDVPTAGEMRWMAIWTALSLVFAGVVFDRRRRSRRNCSASEKSKGSGESVG